jgi:hypothetical protein
VPHTHTQKLSYEESDKKKTTKTHTKRGRGFLTFERVSLLSIWKYFKSNFGLGCVPHKLKFLDGGLPE